ncbi:MAG: thioesterase family protein [Sodalinema sp.]|uniref:acyl-CoA thioesterase n=1 Tax=Sodalinema sp. TaxID=3080550 RepID=UPI00396F34DC
MTFAKFCMIYQHTIRLEDTDAAGVVYFARLLSICHYAYEAAIAQAGVNLAQLLAQGELAIPIVEAHIRFLAPLYWGDEVTIELVPKTIEASQFQVNYTIYKLGSDRPVSQASTHHVCINPKTRQRQPLTPQLAQWLHSERPPAA